MKNWERYINRIANILALVDGKLSPCCITECSECDLNAKECRYFMKKWLNAEYVEKPKLTKKERQLCEVIGTGYIARATNEGIFYFSEKPEKSNLGYWLNPGLIHTLNPEIFKCEFAFIKWEDPEPWSIQDLLKLEVEE